MPIATDRTAFMVSHLHQEEKGTDVNIASHLLMDVLEGRVDGVVVVANDCDLRLPVHIARQRVPVGHVNPRNTLSLVIWQAHHQRGSATTGGASSGDTTICCINFPTASVFRKTAGW